MGSRQDTSACRVRNGSNGELEGPQAQSLLGETVSCRKEGSAERLTLKRELGLFSAVSLILSVMIGAGIFVSPKGVLQHTGSVGEALLVWASCGLISLLGALTFAELGTVVPQSGAEYSFFKAAYSPLHSFWGPLPSFVFIWVVVLILRPAEAAIIILVFADYLTQPLVAATGFCPPPAHRDWLRRLVALLALGLTTYVNIKSVKVFVRMQNVFSSLKAVVCVIVIIGGIYNLSQGNVELLSKGFEGSKTGVKDITLAVFHGLWTYDGWTTVVLVSEEIIKPNRNILRSILIAVPLVTALFTMMNVAYMSVLPVAQMIDEDTGAVAVAFGDKILGPFTFVIPAGVALATFSCSMASQFGVARLTFAAAREGHMPQALSYIDIHRFTPAPAVTLQGILTMIFIVIGDVNSLIEFAGFLIWAFYGLAFIALIVLRRTRPNAYRPYKVPIAVPVLLAGVSAVMTTVSVLQKPSAGHLGAVLFMGLGVLVYHPLVYRRRHFPCLGKFNYFVQVLMQAAEPAKTTGS